MITCFFQHAWATGQCLVSDHSKASVEPQGRASTSKRLSLCENSIEMRSKYKNDPGVFGVR